MKKQKAVIFDIDGVLAEKSLERDYREYDKVHLDSPINLCLKIMNCLALQNPFYHIILITGRKEYCREATTQWIVKNADGLYQEDFDVVGYGISTYNFTLFMRGDKDHRKAHELKREIYEKEIKDKYDVVACFDDEAEIIKMYQEYGLLTFQVGNRI
jgi:FMN phosphatase YigB (HAD superfamily)